MHTGRANRQHRCPLALPFLQHFVRSLSDAAEVALASLSCASASDHCAPGGEQAQQERARVAAQLEHAAAQYERVQDSLKPRSRQQHASIVAEFGSAILAGSQGMLRATSDLAAALQQFCDLPEQQEAAQLELAQAAGARSCAYLRCTQMEQGGGPGAGHGSGSRRCSACRSVW